MCTCDIVQHQEEDAKTTMNYLGVFNGSDDLEAIE